MSIYIGYNGRHKTARIAPPARQKAAARDVASELSAGLWCRERDGDSRSSSHTAKPRALGPRGVCRRAGRNRRPGHSRRREEDPKSSGPQSSGPKSSGMNSWLRWFGAFRSAGHRGVPALLLIAGIILSCLAFWAAGRSASQWAYLALGLLMTLGVVAYAVSERRRRVVIEAEVAERTRDSRQAIAHLAATTAQLRAVIDASPLAIAVIDAARNVATWNLAAERMTGYSAGEMIGNPIPPALGGDSAEFARRFERARSGEILQGIETTRLRKDGRTIETLSSVAAFHDSKGDFAGIVTTTTDVTQRNAMQRQLQHAQKMEAVGQLTGGLAHDFNNLLGIILGNLDILQDIQEAGGEQRELTDAAVQAAIRGAELTRQLLAFARQQPLAPKLVDLNAVLDDSIRLLRRTLGDHITLEPKYSEPLWPVLIDGSQLESAILNLAVNARDAMLEGGKLTIEGCNVVLDEGSAELNPEATPGAYVVVTVSDNGSGMPPEILAKAFDPFFTTKGSRGTGLGLSMVHGFVKQSGGHTRIYSEPGRGTTISMYLPRAKESEAAHEAERPAPQLIK